MSVRMGESTPSVAVGQSPRPDKAAEPYPAWVSEFVVRERRAWRRDGLLVWLERAAIVAVALGVWQVLESVGVINADTISSPRAVAVALGTLLGQASFYTAVRVTVEETMVGFFLGVAAGTLVGLALGLFPRARMALLPWLVAINTIPKIALVPLAIVWLGLGISSKMFISAFGVFFVVCFSVLGGLADYDRALGWNVTILGFSRWRTVRTVLLPSISVWVVTALKVSISFALIGAIIGEYVGSTVGLGYDIETAINAAAITLMVALLVVVALIGSALYALVTLAERWWLRWR